MAKVLIAEDDPFISKILVYRLEKDGYDIDKVDDGDAAIKMIKKNNYSIILLDLIMPVKDGFEVLKEIKKLETDIPVLVFSNLAQDEDKDLAISLGAKEYYVKSDMAIDEVAEKVAMFIKKD